jgi:hypothetical protein
LLDAEDHLAARLARDGDPEEVYFEETETNFATGWKGNCRIDGDAFVYVDKDSGRVVAILGYPRRPDRRVGLIRNFQICLARNYNSRFRIVICSSRRTISKAERQIYIRSISTCLERGVL